MISEKVAVEIAVRVLFMANGQKLTAGQIAERAMQPENLAMWRQMGSELPADADPHVLAGRIGLALSRHVEQKGKNQQVVSGTRKGGWKVGPKGNRGLVTPHSPYALPESTQFTGLAGEYAVISELLACNWNATKLPVDDGVDVVATKGHEIRTVQVKTSHAIQFDPERFMFQIDQESHQRYENIRHYTILVMRRMQPKRWLNDFLLLSNADLRDLMSRGAFSGDQTRWNILIEVRGEEYVVRRDDQTFNLSDRVNVIRDRFL